MYLPDVNRRLTTQGVVYKLDIEECIDCYVDADFYGGWDQAVADSAENFMSCTGYLMPCAGCPLL